MQPSNLSNRAIFESMPRLSDEASELYTAAIEGLADTALGGLRLLKLVDVIGWDTLRDHLIARYHLDEPEGPEWEIYDDGDQEAWEVFKAAADELLAAQNAMVA